ncbi:MAG: histidine--tRNA ligase [Candidatus Hydrothermarchaeales archaeon]
MQFTRPRGTRDFLPEEMAKRRYVEGVMREVFESFGYGEIQTPTFEQLELITTKSGEDIRKHLYFFEDKSGRKLALRPELSAPTMRLFVNELRTKPKPRKIYYFENCFRYERPQAGRYREFWHAGVELIGSGRAEADAEVIYLAVRTLEELGIKDFEVNIGHLGVFRKFLEKCEVDEEVQNTLMGVIDKGDKGALEDALNKADIPNDNKKILLKLINLSGTKNVLKEAEELLRDFGIEELKKFEETLEILETFGVTDYLINFGIARGLDYYTGIVFEIAVPRLGAEKQICGGGSYSLIEAFGGGKTPSCGFAFGFDRIMRALEIEGKSLPVNERTRVFVIPTSKELLNEAIKVADIIRQHTSCEIELMGRKLDKAMKHANNEGIPYVVIVGEEELREGKVVIKDMKTGEQQKIKTGEIRDVVV